MKNNKHLQGFVIVLYSCVFLFYAFPVAARMKIAGSLVVESGLPQDTLVIKGKIAEQFYESKRGIVTDTKEYYFIPDKKEIRRHKLSKGYFIKLWEGKVLITELQKYAGKKVRIKSIFKNGLWDATDTQHASRLGYYVAIFEIDN